MLGIPRDQIGRHDNFFDRGGSSLLAVKLAIALDRAVSLKELTRHPVLADMAALVDGKSESRTGRSDAEIAADTTSCAPVRPRRPKRCLSTPID